MFSPDHSETSRILSNTALDLGCAGWKVHVATIRQI
jgi:hypothetical protein